MVINVLTNAYVSFYCSFDWCTNFIWIQLEVQRKSHRSGGGNNRYDGNRRHNGFGNYGGGGRQQYGSSFRYGGDSNIGFESQEIPNDPPFTVFVGNLPENFSLDAIGEMFNGMTIQNIREMIDNKTGYRRNFVYVEFATKRDMIASLKFNETHMHGNALRVNVAYNKTRQHGGDRGFPGNRRGYDQYDNSPFHSNRRFNGNPNREFPFSNGGGYGHQGQGQGQAQGRRAEEFVEPTEEDEKNRPKIVLDSTSTEKVEWYSRPKSVFGAAKPVDTASSMQKIEEKSPVFSTTRTNPK